MFVFTSFNSSGISSSNMIMCLNELHVTCPRKKEGVWIRGGVWGWGGWREGCVVVFIFYFFQITTFLEFELNYDR